MIDRAKLLSQLHETSILFVDDDIIIDNSIGHVLKHYFKEVYIATNGLDGIEIYKSKSPSIVVTDISMPRMNGLEMAKELKKIDQDLKIIFCTGHNEQSLIEQMSEFGGHYLIKPADSIKLLETISDLF